MGIDPTCTDHEVRLLGTDRETPRGPMSHQDHSLWTGRPEGVRQTAKIFIFVNSGGRYPGSRLLVRDFGVLVIGSVETTGQIPGRFSIDLVLYLPPQAPVFVFPQVDPVVRPAEDWEYVRPHLAPCRSHKDTENSSWSERDLLVAKMISEGRNNHLLSNWKCLIICCVVSMSNCQYGFGKDLV